MMENVSEIVKYYVFWSPAEKSADVVSCWTHGTHLYSAVSHTQPQLVSLKLYIGTFQNKASIKHELEQDIN